MESTNTANTNFSVEKFNTTFTSSRGEMTAVISGQYNTKDFLLVGKHTFVFTFKGDFQSHSRDLQSHSSDFQSQPQKIVTFVGNFKDGLKHGEWTKTKISLCNGIAQTKKDKYVRYENGLLDTDLVSNNKCHGEADILDGVTTRVPRAPICEDDITQEYLECKDSDEWMYLDRLSEREFLEMDVCGEDKLKALMFDSKPIQDGGHCYFAHVCDYLEICQLWYEHKIQFFYSKSRNDFLSVVWRGTIAENVNLWSRD